MRNKIIIPKKYKKEKKKHTTSKKNQKKQEELISKNDQTWLKLKVNMKADSYSSRLSLTYLMLSNKQKLQR